MAIKKPDVSNRIIACRSCMHVGPPRLANGTYGEILFMCAKCGGNQWDLVDANKNKPASVTTRPSGRVDDSLQTPEGSTRTDAPSGQVRKRNPHLVLAIVFIASLVAFFVFAPVTGYLWYRPAKEAIILPRYMAKKLYEEYDLFRNGITVIAAISGAILAVSSFRIYRISSTKVCPMCCKRVAIQARKCPFCQSDIDGTSAGVNTPTVTGDAIIAQQRVDPLQSEQTNLEKKPDRES